MNTFSNKAKEKYKDFMTSALADAMSEAQIIINEKEIAIKRLFESNRKLLKENSYLRMKLRQLEEDKRYSIFLEYEELFK